jgi:capsule polysaccharide export protein KpsE/RkpR
LTQLAAKQTTEEVLSPIRGELSFSEVEQARLSQAERLRVLWHRRHLLLRVAAISIMASTLLAFLIPNQYTSTTQLMPPDAQSSSPMAMMAALAKGAGALGSLAGDLLPIKSNGAMFIGVLRSQTAQERLVQKFDLKKVYGERLVVDARQKLDENTSISEDRKSGIITVNVTDHSKERAAALASSYVEQLNSLVAQLSTSSAHRERVFLEGRLSAVKKNLDEDANQLAQFSSKNNTLDIRDEGRAMLDAAAGIAGQMIAAQSQLEGLRQIYTDSNPRVRSLNAHVMELRKQLDKLGGAKVPTGATGDQAAVDPTSDMPYPSIQKLPLLGVKYADLYRQVKIQETVYELLTQQYEMAKVQEAKEIPSVKTLDPAKIPEKKSFPPRLIIILSGVSLTLVFATIWVLGSIRWDKVDPDDPRKVFFREITATLKWGKPAGSQDDPGLKVASQGARNPFGRPPSESGN